MVSATRARGDVQCLHTGEPKIVQWASRQAREVQQRTAGELIDGDCFERRQPGRMRPQLPRFGMSRCGRRCGWPHEDTSRAIMCCTPAVRLLIVLTLPPCSRCPLNRLPAPSALAGWSAATSCSGPSRHFAAARQLGRFRSEAEIKGQGGSASFVANDPKLPFALAERCRF
jgi:hypothetical protein